MKTTLLQMCNTLKYPIKSLSYCLYNDIPSVGKLLPRKCVLPSIIPLDLVLDTYIKTFLVWQITHLKMYITLTYSIISQLMFYIKNFLAWVNYSSENVYHPAISIRSLAWCLHEDFFSLAKLFSRKFLSLFNIPLDLLINVYINTVLDWANYSPEKLITLQ